MDAVSYPVCGYRCQYIHKGWVVKLGFHLLHPKNLESPQCIAFKLASVIRHTSAGKGWVEEKTVFSSRPVTFMEPLIKMWSNALRDDGFQRMVQCQSEQ